jgi:hypothetical protein
VTTLKFSPAKTRSSTGSLTGDADTESDSVCDYAGCKASSITPKCKYCQAHYDQVVASRDDRPRCCRSELALNFIGVAEQVIKDQVCTLMPLLHVRFIWVCTVTCGFSCASCPQCTYVQFCCLPANCL